MLQFPKISVGSIFLSWLSWLFTTYCTLKNENIFQRKKIEYFYQSPIAACNFKQVTIWLIRFLLVAWKLIYFTET